MQNLLGSSFDCECGKRHEVPTRALLYEAGAVGLLPDIMARYIASRRVTIVADSRTWDICGEKAYAVMRQAGWNASHIIIADAQHSGPVCNDATVAILKQDITGLAERPDILIAVGSGTVNDLTKWAAFELGLPYAVVATAASMNGYSAANVAPMINGVKVLIRAAAPLVVLAESQIIENAPFEMTASGFGDAIAKCISGADWLMNNRLFGEHFCPFCSGIVEGLEKFYLERPQDVKERKPAAIEALFKGLFWSGAAMTMIGSSAPASGGEHLLSHTLDMMAARDGLSHDLHGRQVGLGTVFSAALYERLLAEESLKSVPPAADIDADFWHPVTLKDAVREQWAAKRGDLEKIDKLLHDTSRWQAIRTELESIVRPPQDIRDWLRQAGAACTLSDIGCSRQRLRDALLHMHEIRKRCTVVDLAWAAGIMPHAADEIIDMWMVK